MAPNDLEKEENKEDDYIKEIKPFLNEKGQLKLFPAKNKKKLYALYYLATKFEMEKQYTEFEINSIIGI